MSDWLKVCPLEDIPRLGSRVVKAGNGDIAVFRTATDEVFALNDKCPHKGGPLSQGIVFDRRVTCPLHGLTIQIDSGEAVAPDTGCSHRYVVKVEDSAVFLKL